MQRSPRSRPRRLACAVTAFAVTALTQITVAPATAGATSQPPNILLLVSDDQAWSTFGRNLMPTVYAELVDQGVLFDRAYVNTSLCCPSRSQILTGLYEHHTGVDSNSVKLLRPTIVQALHGVGYRTMLAGKYLNSMPCTPRPEFDRWACLGKQLGPANKVDPTLNVDGQVTQFQGYQTDVLADLVSQFVANTPADQPFFAMWTPTTPHLPVLDLRYDTLAVPRVRGASYDMDTLRTDWPMWTRSLPLTASAKSRIDLNHEQMAQAVRSMDDAVGTMLSSLGDRAADTIVIYVSDNGFQYGEHRRTGKNDPFEPSMKVPLIVRVPGAAVAGTTSHALVENIDITSTIADAAGIGWGADGSSLLPIVRGEATTVRDTLLIERRQGVEGLPRPHTGFEVVTERFSPPSFTGVITDGWKYVELWTGEHMLFDLTLDPQETLNLADTPATTAIQVDLQARMAALLAPPEPETTIVEGPSGFPLGPSGRFTYTTQSRFATFACRLTHDTVAGAWHPCGRWSTVEGGLDGGDWRFEVVATDETGATDPTPAFRDFSIAARGPAVDIVDEPPPQVADGDLSFAFSSPVSDATFECRFARLGKSATWEQCTSPMDYAGLGGGFWEFRARATDPSSGAVTHPPAGRIVLVDTLAPVFDAVRRPPEVTSSAEADFFVAPLEPVTDLRCAIDDAVAQPCRDGTLVASGLSHGVHEAVFSGVDAVGNTGFAAFTWRVDRETPTARISSGPTSSTSRTTATFEFGSSDANSWFLCTLDGSARFPCEQVTTIAQLAPGDHVLAVRAVDHALNTSAPIAYRWTIRG